MRFHELPFVQQMQVRESNVRGTYICIACDFESLMEDLIVLCELPEEKLNAAGVLEMKLKKTTQLEMGKKYRRAKDGLEKYNSEYHNDFLPHFTVIAKLVKYRTILAHGYSEFDPHQKDNTWIAFNYHDKGKMKQEKIIILPFIMQLEEYRKSIMELAGLVVQIRKDRNVLLLY